MTTHIICAFDLAGTLFSVQVYEQLTRKLFAGHPDVQVVELRPLPGGSSGLSAISVLLAHPSGELSGPLNPWLVRFGTKAMLSAEHERYRRYVGERLGMHTAHERLYTDLADYNAAVIAYNYLSRRGEPLHTLRSMLADDEHLPEIFKAVASLFSDTLCQGDQQRGWYNDSRIYAEQRPLWFYNAILPPTVTLHGVQLGTPPAGTPLIETRLAQADQPNSVELLGVQLAIPTRRLVFDELGGNGTLMRVLLMEHEDMPDARAIHRPLTPVAARLELEADAATIEHIGALLGADNVVLTGRVQQTRYGQLESYRQRLGLHSRNDDGYLVSKDLPFRLPNPISRYYGALSWPRQLHTSIVHGDMNLSNVLLSRTSGQTELSAWLIDFDKASSGGHSIFDAVKLETEYKLHILPHRLRGIDDFLILEMALHQALTLPTQAWRTVRGYGALEDAFEFLSIVRRQILYEVYKDLPAERRALVTPSPEEYYLGLLAYGLAVLKYPNLYRERSGGWVDSSKTCLAQLATAGYISAAFAAAALPDTANLVAGADTYPPPNTPRKARGNTLRRLIGRNEELAEARQQLRLQSDSSASHDGSQVVVLYGQLGSGREAVAQVLASELKERNFDVLPSWPQDDQTASVEGFVTTVLAALKEAPVPTPLPTAYRITLREDYLKSCHNALIEALERRHRRNKPRVGLVVNLQNPDHEIERFVGNLCFDLPHAALIGIANRRIARVPAGTLVEIGLLSESDVRSFVRDQRQLALDEQGIAHLHQLSGGRPRALIEYERKAWRIMMEQHCTFQEALMSIIPDNDFIRDLFARFSEPARQLSAVEALLAEHAPWLVARATEITTWITPALGWSYAQNMPQPFHEEVTASQRQLLYDLVRAQLPPELQRRILVQLARFAREMLAEHHDLTSPPGLVIAARLYGAAGDWQAAAQVSLELGVQRQNLFSAHSEALYEVLQKVLNERRLQPEEAALLELAGDCASYLGQYEAALVHYTDLLGQWSQEDPRYPSVLTRLLKLHLRLGQSDEIPAYSEELSKVTTSDNPLHALAQAYSAAAQMNGNPEVARAGLATALEAYKATQDSWLGERTFYYEELIQIHEQLARAQLLSDHSDEAVKTLQAARALVATAELAKPIGARIDSLLGYVFYYGKRTRVSVKLARTRYEAALTVRKAYGDREGHLHTGQNLANLYHDTAQTENDLNQAERIFRENMELAQLVEVPQRELYTANYMDLLIHRAKFTEARLLYEAAAQRSGGEAFEEVEPNTRFVLWLNRAKLALWTGDAENCAHYLARSHDGSIGADEAAEAADLLDQVEWAQLACELHLRLGWPLDHSVAETINANAELAAAEADEAAPWLLASGLLALAQGETLAAQGAIEQAQRLWSAMESRFQAALAACWLVFVAVRAGDRIAIARASDDAQTLLKYFGTTAPGLWLEHLLAGNEES